MSQLYWECMTSPLFFIHSEGFQKALEWKHWVIGVCSTILVAIFKKSVYNFECPTLFEGEICFCWLKGRIARWVQKAVDILMSTDGCVYRYIDCPTVYKKVHLGLHLERALTFAWLEPTSLIRTQNKAIGHSLYVHLSCNLHLNPTTLLCFVF